MADDFIKITVEGDKKIIAALTKFPREIAKYLQSAGAEAAKKEILPTQGLQKYPPATAANAPPEPYYIRGRGTMYKSGLRATSERLGTQWYTKKVQSFSTEIGNRTSYAKWAHGEEQARAMARIGWRKLGEVVTERMQQVVAAYQRWVDKLLRDLNL